MRPDAVTSVRATTLRTEVFGVVRKEILSGRLAPGMKLIESELASRLGVSRNPIREAIGRLEQQGLVVSIPNRGTFVVQPNTEQARDMFLLRAYLELLALRLAFADWKPERFAPLPHVVNEMRELVRTAAHLDGELWGSFSLLDTEFHTRLVRASGSAALLRAWETAAPTDIIFLYDRTRTLSSSAPELEAMVARHEALLHALQSGDAHAAQAQLRMHFTARSREGTVALDDTSLAILGWDRTTLGDGPP
jgi:DNA-binding GntR family transcriptional regulator